MFNLVEQFCLKDSLSTYDPYDVWKTNLGCFVKKGYYEKPLTFVGPAACLTLFDFFLNNRIRLFYKKQEYSIVRGQAANILLNCFIKNRNKEYLCQAKKHIDWLLNNYSVGYSGYCWGLGFKWPAGKNLVYEASTPHVTHTPYVLEAIWNYYSLTGDKQYLDNLYKCLNFFENDLVSILEDEYTLAVSYGPFNDRIVTNASSYALMSLSLIAKAFPEKANVLQIKINKLYNFIVSCQQKDGSWLYSPVDSNSFIDCFHSCIILKNLIKSNNYCSLPNCSSVVDKGFQFIQANFYDPKIGLYKRFAKHSKYSLVKFDLYDNAEVLVILKMLGKNSDALSLEKAIESNFIKGKNIFSVLDIFYCRRNKNLLRWAVMPYLYSLSI